MATLIQQSNLGKYYSNILNFCGNINPTETMLYLKLIASMINKPNIKIVDWDLANDNPKFLLKRFDIGKVAKIASILSSSQNGSGCKVNTRCKLFNFSEIIMHKPYMIEQLDITQLQQLSDITLLPIYFDDNEVIYFIFHNTTNYFNSTKKLAKDIKFLLDFKKTATKHINEVNHAGI